LKIQKITSAWLVNSPVVFLAPAYLDQENRMPFITVDKWRMFYRLEGAARKPVMVLSHSIGTDHAMWGPQMPDLLRHFQVLRFDTRGHGASDSPPGEYSVEQLGHDALAILDRLGLDRVAWCGLSMGGAIGQWIALNAADRLTHLVLANTAPRFGERSNWENRIKAVREGGMSSIVGLALPRFFSEDTLKTKTPFVDSIRSVLVGTDAAGYMGCCAALRDFDSTQDLHRITTRTLVIAGNKDVSTPWLGAGEVLANQIRDAASVRLPAAHLSNMEQPRSFTAALLEFMLPASQALPVDEGAKVRRAVLGNAHVERSLAAATDFNRDFQELITTYAWGTIWTRPLLDNRARRLIVLAMMASLGRWEEFRMHVAAGSEHELEPCDLKEILLLVAIYAGVPAANTAFQIADEELNERSEE
jgi:3-oxoadipate enol-lactonase / 4-carboxymuconolactone decarboxylase